MALPRRLRKFSAALGTLFWAFFAVLAGLDGGTPAGAVTERIVNGFYTGLAISGYDPVAYFTETAPTKGSANYELTFEKVVWRFRNDGNRAAFEGNPEVYQPRYGGYDPVGIGRGVALAGNPLVWSIVGDRLYLFYSEAARAAFIADPRAAIAAADGRWQDVRQQLPD
jgi:hypothetical protein